jgi:hypothetical protein
VVFGQCAQVITQVIKRGRELAVGELVTVATAGLCEPGWIVVIPPLRSSLDGAICLHQSSRWARALLTPRGQMRSTSTRLPSAAEGSS